MATEEATTRHFEIAGLRVRTHTHGDGPPVLVLHGWGGSIESVRPISAALRDVATTYAVDLPGFGESDPPPEPWGAGEYAAFIRDLMDALALDAATVVGHSFGGRVGIRLAVDFPERVARLVLVNSAGLRPRRTAKYYRRVALAKLGKVIARIGGGPGARLRARIVQRTASPDYLNAGPLRPTFVRIVNEDLRNYLPRIAVPTLLIWGDGDQETPLSDGQLMEKLIPDAGLVVFEHAGHYSYVDAAHAFGRVVRHFVSTEQAA
jgi:pimeloyl-ACP methyl ester carboxylesterase